MDHYVENSRFWVGFRGDIWGHFRPAAGGWGMDGKIRGADWLRGRNIHRVLLSPAAAA